MSTLQELKIQEAIKEWGEDAVLSTISMVYEYDPDIVYTHAEDMGMFDVTEIVSFLFFNEFE